MLFEKCVHGVDVVDLAVGCDHEHGVAGKAGIKWSQTVELEGSLHFIERKPGGEAEAEDHVSLARAFLLGNQLVAVPLRDIRRDENVLLAEALGADPLADVVRKGTVCGHDFFLMFLQDRGNVVRLGTS